MSILTGSDLPQAPVPASDEQVLERRKEALPSVNVPVTVTVLGMHSEGIMKAQVMEVSGRGMRVRLPLPIAAGAPVQVEGNDALFLGEVCHSEAVDGGYVVRLMLSHSLTPLSELDRLSEGLRNEGLRKEGLRNEEAKSRSSMRGGARRE